MKNIKNCFQSKWESVYDHEVRETKKALRKTPAATTSPKRGVATKGSKGVQPPIVCKGASDFKKNPRSSDEGTRVTVITPSEVTIVRGAHEGSRVMYGHLWCLSQVGEPEGSMVASGGHGGARKS
jgi:hypothetical protein